MKLLITGIGAIRQAEIDLSDLTVVAGENDTGKSTVGKVIFSIVQAFSSFPVAVKKAHEEKLYRRLQGLYIEIRRNLDLSDRTDLKDLLFSLRSRGDLNEDASSFVSAVKKIIKTDSAKVNKIALSKIEVLISDLDDYLGRNGINEGAISKFIHQALKSEFNGKILHCEELSASIVIHDGLTRILEMNFNDRSVINFYGGEPLGISDATFLDGPAILQYYPAMPAFNVIGERELLRTGSIPYHCVNLASKIRAGVKGEPLAIFGDALDVDISSIIDGVMSYNEKEDNFLFSRGSVKFLSNNVASGIKALFIVDILIRGEYIRRGTLLIIDEPETNLHPKWQIEYAKKICQLCECGVTILIATHSPYIIEALHGYGKRSNISSGFYMAKREGDGCTYVSADGDIASIVETLATPLSDLLDELDE